MPSKDETVYEDRPVADWAFKEAQRRTGLDVMEYNWKYASASFKELARMIEKYEEPPASPELLAARKYFAKQLDSNAPLALIGRYDNGLVVQAFLSGAAWAKEDKQ